MALDLYTLRTGFDQTTGVPDNGTDTVMDMTAWVQNGIRIDSQNLDVPLWSTVDPANDDHVGIAIGFTGPLGVTLALPIALQDPSKWPQAPGNDSDWVAGSWGEHRACVGAFNERQRVFRTWGMDLILHPDSWDRYVLAADASLSREWFNATGLSPSNLDWVSLDADMQAITV